MATDISLPTLDPIGEINKYDFRNEEHYVFKAKKGLNREIVAEISEMKNEPPWMRDYRLAAYDIFRSKPMPHWGGNIAVKFDDIYYYLKPTDGSVGSWDEVPDEIKTTFDKLGIPEAEKKFLAGVKAQYESEVVYGSLREDLAKQGVLFTDMDTALREHPGYRPRVFRHDHPLDRQQIRGPEFGRLVGRIVRLCAARREDRFPAASLFPHQRREHGPVRTHADHHRRRRAVPLRRRLHRADVQHRKPPRRRGRSDRQTRRALPLHDHPKLVQQHLQPGDQTRPGVRRFAGGMGRWKPRQPA